MDTQDSKIINSINAGVFVLDLNNKIISWNHWLSLHTGVSQKEALNKEVSEIFDMTEEQIMTCQRLIDTSVKLKNLSFFTADGGGNLFPIKLKKTSSCFFDFMQQDVTFLPFDDDDKKKISVIIYDQTALMCSKKDTLDLLAYHKEKRKNIEKRKIAEIKESFLILFTHELKTPLNSIINFTKYLLGHAQTGKINDISLEKRVKLLEQIEISSQSMLHNVSDILDISKIQSKKLSYQITTFEITEIIREMINTHKGLALEYNVQIMFDYENKKYVYINSDAYRFKQIVSNILSNAIKYSRGEVLITLKTDPKAFTLFIEDNGEGIEDTKNIFNLFEQFDDGDQIKKKKGTGVGLTFVKLLCEDLGFTYELDKSSILGGLKFALKKNEK